MCRLSLFWDRNILWGGLPPPPHFLRNIDVRPIKPYIFWKHTPKLRKFCKKSSKSRIVFTLTWSWPQNIPKRQTYLLPQFSYDWAQIFTQYSQTKYKTFDWMFFAILFFSICYELICTGLPFFVQKTPFLTKKWFFF